METPRERQVRNVLETMRVHDVAYHSQLAREAKCALVGHREERIAVNWLTCNRCGKTWESD